MFPKMKRCWVLLLVIGLCLALAAPLWAASGPELLRKGVEHYEYAEFEQAARMLQQALAAPGLSSALKAKANAYLGLVALAQGDETAASRFFSAAKASDPGFKPDPRRFPPRAQKLFAQAAGGAPPTTTASVPTTTTPPPPPKPKPKKRKSRKPPRPARGYVVDVSGNEVVLDMGKKQGVKVGQSYEVFVVKILRHPVTHKRLVKKTKRGVVRVVEVDKDLATARIVSGKGRIKPGQRIRKLASATPGRSPRKPAGGKRLVMMPPLSGEEPAEGITARAVARALNHIKGLPYQAVALSPAQLRKTKRMGFDPENYLLMPGVTLRSLSEFFSEDKKDKDIMDARLKPEEVALLKEVLQALGARAIFIWKLEYAPASETVETQADLICNLHLYGKDKPALREKVTISGSKLGPLVAAQLKRLVAKALK